eukprot:Hpha_TRINITY_DN17894_c0_g1::TRINITY_DN17894_c0_g1_i1::g.177489::m.177489
METPQPVPLGLPDGLRSRGGAQTPMGRMRTQSLVSSRGGTPPASETEGRLQRRGTASSISSHSSHSSQWSGRSSEAWSDGKARRRLQTEIPSGGEQLDPMAAVAVLRKLVKGEASIQSIAAVVSAHVHLAERMLLRLLREIQPEGPPPALESALPPKAEKAVRAYGVTELGSVSSAAASLCQGQKVLKFVRDSWRVCDGLPSVSEDGGLSDTDLCTFVDVFDLAAPIARLAAARGSNARPEKRRISADPTLTLEAARPAVQSLNKLLAACKPNNIVQAALRAAMRQHQGLAEAVLLRVLVGLAPEGSRCAKLTSARDTMPGAGAKMLKAYGVNSQPNETTIADAAEVLTQGKSLDRFIRDACRMATDLDPAVPVSEPVVFHLVSVFRLQTSLSTLPCQGACKACWELLGGGKMRTDDEIERIVDAGGGPRGAIGGASTWAQQTLASVPRGGAEHLKDLQELGALATPPAAAAAKPRRPKSSGTDGGGEEEFPLDSDVLVLDDVARVKQMVSSARKLGWHDDMANYCGSRGRVKRYDARDRKYAKVQIMHDDLVTWTWPIAAVSIIAGEDGGAVQSPPPQPPRRGDLNTPPMQDARRPGSGGASRGLPPLRHAPSPLSGGGAPSGGEGGVVDFEQAERLAALRAALPSLASPPPPPGSAPP